MAIGFVRSSDGAQVQPEHGYDRSTGTPGAQVHLIRDEVLFPHGHQDNGEAGRADRLLERKEGACLDLIVSIFKGGGCSPAITDTISSLCASI